MQAAVDWVNGWVWSPALVYLCLAVGLCFSIRTRFMQLRHMGGMLGQMFRGKSSAAGVSSFQALTIALSGRVGTGNIAGVATAIGFGGPGAVFWMWMVAFLGAATAYVESTLGQIYKTEHHGLYRGGPAYYIEKGLGWRRYALVFALATLVACGVLLPGVQTNSIAAAMENAFHIAPAVSGTIIVILLGLIIFGGVRRIAQVTQIVVPFMALGYMLAAAVVVVLNIEQLPGVIVLIVSSAFGAEAGFGAMMGLAIQWGVKRGVYSNEAGQGTGPHAAAAAEVSHPAAQGLVQAFSVYIDTLFVCTATALMILIAGTYNVTGADGAPVFTGLANISAGTGFTQAAMESVLPGFGAMFVAVALFFFAFTTVLAYYYIAETNLAYLTRNIRADGLMFGLRIALIGSALYGCIRTSDLAWGLGDIGVGVMAWLNIFAVLALRRPALLALRDYEAQQEKGRLQPEFDPRPLGIESATWWVERAQGRKRRA
jgi:AGCS family alanine or glycine:cation symporter